MEPTREHSFLRRIAKIEQHNAERREDPLQITDYHVHGCSYLHPNRSCTSTSVAAGKEKGRPRCPAWRFWRPQQESNLQPLAPEPVRSDNGPECIAQKISRWLSSASGGTLYTQKAGPWDHGYVERFNGRPRDELLNRELFLRPPEARYGLDAWRLECTHRRPHRGIRWQTPAAFATAREDKTARQDSGWRR